MSSAVLTISSKNYGAWALRGWLMARFAGLDFTERVIPPDDPAMKAEILLLSSSIRVPCLEHDGARVWDTLAIGEYLNEIRPEAALLPGDLRRNALGVQRAALVAADEHQGPFPEVQTVVAGRKPMSTASSRSGPSACKPTQDPICSAPALASPTRCSRRWSRASSPTRWHSTRPAPTTATRSWPWLQCRNGWKRPGRNRTRSTSWTPSSESPRLPGRTHPVRPIGQPAPLRSLSGRSRHRWVALASRFAPIGGFD